MQGSVKILVSSFLRDPLNSSFSRRSKTLTTIPMKMQTQMMVNHRSQLNGLNTIHMSFGPLLCFTFISMLTPDSKYGNVKSTQFILLATIDISPTAASIFYVIRTLQYIIRNIQKANKCDL